MIERMGGAVQLSSGADATSITTQGDLTAVRSLELRLAGGDDRVNIAGVGGLHNLIASGDGGALDFKVTDSSFQKLNLRDANAELTVTIEDTEFSGGAFIEAGAGEFQAQIINVDIGSYFTVRRPTDGGANGIGELEIRDSSMRTVNIEDEFSRHDVAFVNSSTASSFKLESGRNLLNLDIRGSQIGRTLTVVDPHGFADIDIRSGSSVGGTTNIKHLGSGTMEVLIDNATLQATRITSELGDALVTIGGDARLTGNFNFHITDGNSALHMGESSTIVGLLNQKTFGGGDSLTYLTDQATVTKTVTVSNQEGVSDVQIVDNAQIKNFQGSGFIKISNEVFSDRGTETLEADIYVPNSLGPHPGIVMIHGGYWRFGNKNYMTSRAKQLAQRGYVVMNIEYRLAPDDPFPAQIHDVHTAIMWLKANAATYNVDAGKVGLYGYSAGGHLALLAGLTDSSDGLDGPDAGLADPGVSAIIAGAPATDFRDLDPNSTQLAYWLGGTRADLPEIYELASPAAFVDGADPPTFIFIGEDDDVVSTPKAQRLSDNLNGLGGTSEFYGVPGKNHLSAAKDRAAMMRASRFLDSHIKR